ncbi:palmitoyltransferase ZDHHC4 isoform X2 [Nerophis ophidion]|uniref:palmitoyltransferase ZDHHC4 isoform X2 n=1 Tax=Nerophis ophidion TaxID=159077 RepID=UPI002ADF804C|nr:palmitoyltransferase ZDHHC4 isoform X2 [Nerophis ophidion]
MDFLTLFAIYVALVLTCIVLVCKYSGQKQSPLNIFLSCTIKVFAPITPKWLQRFSQWTMHTLFHQRDMDTTLTSLSVPYILLTAKTVFFYLCIKKDPGTVTMRNVSSQLYLYPYDKRLFHPGVTCPTCKLIKPARSKHCKRRTFVLLHLKMPTLSALLLDSSQCKSSESGVCNRCVRRFDHHCIWVNNCIGGQNTRYFMLYLFSVCAMAGDISLLTVDMLLHAVLRSGLLRASYIDEHGQQQPAGPVFVIQHLFLTFPRIIFMLGFVVFVFFLLAGYALFHSFLVLVNQTSNEWYKSRGFSCHHCRPTSTADHLCGTAPSRKYFYSRGLLRNLGEIFFPRQPFRKKHT